MHDIYLTNIYVDNVFMVFINTNFYQYQNIGKIMIWIYLIKLYLKSFLALKDINHKNKMRMVLLLQCFLLLMVWKYQNVGNINQVY